MRERCPSLVRECHVLLPLLEEMEKHINAFYQALERASRITSAARDSQASQTQQKHKWQVRRPQIDELLQKNEKRKIIVQLALLQYEIDSP